MHVMVVPYDSLSLTTRSPEPTLYQREMRERISSNVDHVDNNKIHEQIASVLEHTPITITCAEFGDGMCCKALVRTHKTFQFTQYCAEI